MPEKKDVFKARTPRSWTYELHGQGKKKGKRKKGQKIQDPQTPHTVLQKSSPKTDILLLNQSQFLSSSRVARLAFSCQLSQIWRLLNWLAIKISCWHFRMKCQQVICFTANHFTICQFWESWHKKRQPGNPEDDTWQWLQRGNSRKKPKGW